MVVLKKFTSIQKPMSVRDCGALLVKTNTMRTMKTRKTRKSRKPRKPAKHDTKEFLDSIEILIKSTKLMKKHLENTETTGTSDEHIYCENVLNEINVFLGRVLA